MRIVQYSLILGDGIFSAIKVWRTACIDEPAIISCFCQRLRYYALFLSGASRLAAISAWGQLNKRAAFTALFDQHQRICKYIVYYANGFYRYLLGFENW